jgi:hypothetical protein
MICLLITGDLLNQELPCAFFIHDLSPVVTGGAGTGYPSGAHELTLVFRGVPVARSLVYCVVF